MAEKIKWIKLAVDIFENRKIKQIRHMKNGDTLVVIWLQLLTLAGSINDDGRLYLTDGVAYTEQMLASEFYCSTKIVHRALEAFERFGMIGISDEVIRVTNWGKYQSYQSISSASSVSNAKEQTRKRVAEYRERQKLLSSDDDCNVTCNGDVTQGNVTGSVTVTQEEVEQEEIRNKNKKENRNIENNNIYNNSFSNSNSKSNSNNGSILGNKDDIEVIYSFVLNDKTVHVVTKGDYMRYRELYPAVDVMQQFRNMAGWFDGNPDRRKTAKGIKRFINAWLSKEQNKGGVKNASSFGHVAGRYESVGNGEEVV